MIALLLALAAGPAQGEIPPAAGLDPAAWKIQSPLPAAVQHHRALVLDDVLWVLGGRDRFNKLQPAVLHAPLSADGTVGAWSRGPDLPAGVAMHGAAVLNGSLWVVGGLKAAKAGEAATDEVWMATPARGGTLRGWTRAGRLPEAVSGHGVVAAGGRLWVVGGVGPGGYRNAVWSAAPGDGRAPLAWKPATPLPVATGYASLLGLNGFLVMAGGQTPGEGRTLVLPTSYVAPIMEDGVLPTWYLASAKLPGAWLSFGRNQANLVAWHDTLFCLGGQDALWFLLDSVAATTFDPRRGDLGSWGVIQGGPDMPQLTAAATWKDWLYLVGGTVKGAVSARVLRGVFRPGTAEEGS